MLVRIDITMSNVLGGRWLRLGRLCRSGLTLTGGLGGRVGLVRVTFHRLVRRSLRV